METNQIILSKTCENVRKFDKLRFQNTDKNFLQKLNKTNIRRLSAKAVSNRFDRMHCRKQVLNQGVYDRQSWNLAFKSAMCDVILWVLSGLATERGILTWGGVMSGQIGAKVGVVSSPGDNGQVSR